MESAKMAQTISSSTMKSPNIAKGLLQRLLITVRLLLFSLFTEVSSGIGTYLLNSCTGP